MLARACSLIDEMAEAGADFVHLANDVACTSGTFVSPTDFREFMLPYLAQQVEHIRRRGMLPFVHSDGNIMSVLDDYLSLGAACFQSVDPMAGMDIAEVKRRCHRRMALMGNVHCSLLLDGPKEAIRRSAGYCLKHGTPGGGYIFGTSNTIFNGMPLENYDYMLQVYHEFCRRRNPVTTTG
jgi:uroporphyrinogen decarboxylase